MLTDPTHPLNREFGIFPSIYEYATDITGMHHHWLGDGSLLDDLPSALNAGAAFTPFVGYARRTALVGTVSVPTSALRVANLLLGT